MSRQWWAYAAYLVGSGIFLVASLTRGSPLLATGSALFLLGTLLFAVPDLVRGRRSGRRRPGAHTGRSAERGIVDSPTRGGAAR